MDNDRSTGGVALITGAGTGFGLLGAVALAKRGFRVFASMRDLGRQGRLQQAAARAGVSVEALALDVTSPPTIEAAVAEIARRAGGVDVLVNNAGVGMLGSFEDHSDAELREVFETNFFGLCAVTRAVVPRMRERRRGRLINVSSVGGRVGTPGIAGYSAAKFAVEGVSESLSMELAPFGVSVSIVEPGGFKTDMIGPKRRMTARAADPRSPYHRYTAAIAAHMQRQFDGDGPDPQAVADVIVEAATAERPKLRYRVGNDAHVVLSLKDVLPDRAFERFFAWSFDRVVMRAHRP